GHPKPWHGTDALLDLSLALCGRGIDARLVVIGGGPGAGELRRAFEEKGLGDRVEVTGPLSQEAAITVYRGCHVGLAPYEDRDDFYFCPLKVLESLAAGVPLVASRIGDIPDLVQDAAWLVEPGHREALADTVAAALANPDARHDLARRGRARVLGNYVWQRHAERILDAVMALKTSR
ncbi:MAG: glycosyltransferase, partial [Planctomycetes bacterium]|nr:glycosyltransferase [Planctomycetota bacterium]